LLDNAGDFLVRKVALGDKEALPTGFLLLKGIYVGLGDILWV
jgi:hypothetical protein